MPGPSDHALQDEHAVAGPELGDDWSAPYDQGGPTEAGDQEDVEKIALRAARRKSYLPRMEQSLYALEQAFDRADRPASLAYAMPFVRRMAAAPAGTWNGLAHALALANAVASAAVYPEASAIEPIELSVARGAGIDVSPLLGKLSAQLLEHDPLAALAVADLMAKYSQQSGLGLRQQILDTPYRLNALTALGRYADVLHEVDAFRRSMEALPTVAGAELDQVWGTILKAGYEAAMLSETWEAALELNEEVVLRKEARGDDPLQLARRRLDDYRALLQLGRYDEARDLLKQCEETFARANDALSVGIVYTALADLEDAAGDRTAAAGYGQAALENAYAVGSADLCAIAHAGFAFCLRRASAEPGLVLVHSLAAALIWYQTRSPAFAASLPELASSGIRRPWPTFAELIAAVDGSTRAAFGALFEHLPRRSADGDSAMAAVREQAVEERLGEWRARARRNWLRQKL